MHRLQQRLLLVAGWLAAAVGAGLVATAAVAVAGGQVLDQPLRPLTAAEVAALPVEQAGSPDDVEPQASGGLEPDAGEPAGGSESGDIDPGDVGEDRGNSVIVAPSTGLEAYGPVNPSTVRTGTVEGGHASFLITTDGLSLLWATPAAGYIAHTRSADPETVTVVFSSGLRAWLIEARFDGTDIVIDTRPEKLT
ncbi:MAG: hypothetical protein ABFR53_01370 [Actinomycetota bacterium]